MNDERQNKSRPFFNSAFSVLTSDFPLRVFRLPVTFVHALGPAPEAAPAHALLALVPELLVQVDGVLAARAPRSRRPDFRRRPRPGARPCGPSSAPKSRRRRRLRTSVRLR